MDAATLHQAIVAAGCPTVSTRVVDPDERSTWSFEPDASATPEQIALGNDVIATIAVDAQPPPDPAPEDVVLYDHENRLRAIEGVPPLSLGDFVQKKARK